jgi:large subunit ribosomal protein L9
MAKSPAAKPAAKAKPKAKPAATKASAPALPRQPGVERRKNHPLRAQNGHMRVLLTHRVDKLGGPGDLVKVRPGYARNFLIPQGLATFATPHNVRMVDKHRERLRQVEEAKRADLQNLAAQIAQRSISIEANANAEGHLYGSVTAAMIAATLRGENLPVEEENIRIDGPIRELGLYTIPLTLGLDVTTEIKLWVVPTHTDETPAG